MQSIEQLNVSKSDVVQLPKASVNLSRVVGVITLLTSLVSCEMKSKAQEGSVSDKAPVEEKVSCCSVSKTCELPRNIQLSDLLINDSGIKITKSLNPPSSEDMVLIPSKTVIMGGGKEDTAPASEVKVKSFSISKTETSNKDFARFIEETGYVTVAERPWALNPGAPLNPPSSLVFVAPKEYDPKRGSSQWWKNVQGADWKHPEGPGSDLKGRENLPVVHVTIEDALAYAKWAGRSIPTEAQFRAAATIGDLVKPNNIEPNVKEVNFYQGHFPINNLGLDQHVGIAPVASFKPNANGIYDISGNAWELTRSFYDSSKEFVVIAGGSFLCSWEGDFTCTNASPFGRNSQDKTSSSNHVTFRTVSAE